LEDHEQTRCLVKALERAFAVTNHITQAEKHNTLYNPFGPIPPFLL